jgi:hypothetical protein
MCGPIVPCCGQRQEYCECSPYKRDYALIVAAALEDCPPAPKLPKEDYGEPPF